MAWTKKNQIALLTERLEKVSGIRDQSIHKYELYRNKYQNLLNLTLDETVHMILGVCTIDASDFVIYISDFIHSYNSVFSLQYDSYFEMTFVMKLLDVPYFQEAARAQVEIYGKNMEIVNIDAACFRKGYGGKIFDYIERYAAANDIEKIHGGIYTSTPIGLDNLIRFYKKHDCEVYEVHSSLHFRKYLNKV